MYLFNCITYATYTSGTLTGGFPRFYYPLKYLDIQGLQHLTVIALSQLSMSICVMTANTAMYDVYSLVKKGWQTCWERSMNGGTYCTLFVHYTSGLINAICSSLWLSFLWLVWFGTDVLVRVYYCLLWTATTLVSLSTHAVYYLLNCIGYLSSDSSTSCLIRALVPL